MIVFGLASERSTVVDFKGSHFEREIILWGVRWYVAYPISYRKLEEMMEERGVEVDHSSLNRWCSSMRCCWTRPFRHASVGWAAAGEWTKPPQRAE
jgi:transposase-like protein